MPAGAKYIICNFTKLQTGTQFDQETVTKRYLLIPELLSFEGALSVHPEGALRVRVKYNPNNGHVISEKTTVLIEIFMKGSVQC